MKIALIGYGKMGKMLDRLAAERGHEVVARIDPKGNTPTIDAASLKNADVCIEFTHPDKALDNIRKIARLKKNLVVGTTGWYGHLDEVKAVVAEHGIGFLYAPNFSVGATLFLKIVAEAAAIIGSNSPYDVAGYEAHHNQKVDAPSGLAKEVIKAVAEKLNRKEIPFTSLRCGSIPGTHRVIFDSPVDTITITHEARNREGFAHGSLAAAEWLEGKTGFYTLEDLMENR